jgi:acylphosphatase
VFFRDTCRREARARRISGWVTNTDDGAVEAVFEGEPDAVQELVDWAGRGPSQAEVAGIEVFEEPVRGEQGFQIV